MQGLEGRKLEVHLCDLEEMEDRIQDVWRCLLEDITDRVDPILDIDCLSYLRRVLRYMHLYRRDEIDDMIHEVQIHMMECIMSRKDQDIGVRVHRNELQDICRKYIDPINCRQRRHLSTSINLHISLQEYSNLVLVMEMQNATNKINGKQICFINFYMFSNKVYQKRYTRLSNVFNFRNIDLLQGLILRLEQNVKFISPLLIGDKKRLLSATDLSGLEGGDANGPTSFRK